MLPIETSWSTIKSNYFEIKNQFQLKYNTGKSYEFFTKPYFEGDGYEMQAIGADKCTYSTFWKPEFGHITLSIETLKRICIGYQDGINGDINIAEEKEVISKDI